MRRLAGIGIALLGLAGCQSLPSLVRIEVDGSTLEFKKKAPAAPEPPAAESNGAADAPTP